MAACGNAGGDDLFATGSDFTSAGGEQSKPGTGGAISDDAGGCAIGDLRTCACEGSGSGKQECIRGGTYEPCRCESAGGAGGAQNLASGGSSSGVGRPFSTCLKDADCADSLVCVRLGDGALIGPEAPGFCTSGGCAATNVACPSPSENFEAECSRTGRDVCVIPCELGDDGGCPGGMVCERVSPDRAQCNYPGPEDTDYQACSGDDQCSEGQRCQSVWAYCTEECSSDDDCKQPSNAPAVAVCSTTTQDCVLTCRGDGDCPDEMSCAAEVLGVRRCTF